MKWNIWHVICLRFNNTLKLYIIYIYLYIKCLGIRIKISRKFHLKIKSWFHYGLIYPTHWFYGYKAVLYYMHKPTKTRFYYNINILISFLFNHISLVLSVIVLIELLKKKKHLPVTYTYWYSWRIVNHTLIY